MSEIISERLKKLIAEKRYSKAEISERLCIGYSTLWRRLNGERSVNIDFLLELAKVLDTSVSYLIGETDNSERDVNIAEQKMHIHMQNTSTDDEPTNYAYWGGVLDEARRVAAHGDEEEMRMIEPLLAMAYRTLSSGMNKLRSGKTNGTAIDVSAYNGDHSSYTGNSLMVGKA